MEESKRSGHSIVQKGNLKIAQKCLLLVSLGLMVVGCGNSVNENKRVTLNDSSQENLVVRVPGGFLPLVERPTMDQDGTFNIGDLMFTEDDLMTQKKANLELASIKAGSRWAWPGGQVPYRFASNFNGDRKKINELIQEFNQLSVVNFFPHSDQQDYIEIQDADKSVCGSSYIGKRGGKQILRIRCVNRHTVHHELMHALGFMHTHQRPDRDNFVSVNWGNIKEGKEGNFDKVSGDWYTTFGPYDYNSVMHYGSRFFSVDKSSKVTLAKNDGGEIGYNDKMSDNDIAALRDLYENQHVITGAVDKVVNGVAHGWACAKNDDRQVDVHIYLDGPAGQGTMVASGATTVDTSGQDRNGITQHCSSSTSKRRFEVQIPGWTAHSGKKVFVHGIHPYSNAGHHNRLLHNSGNILVDQDSTIIGSVDLVQNGKVFGWACAKTRNDIVDVHVYVGGPASGSGINVASGKANVESSGEDLNAIRNICSTGRTAYRYSVDIPNYESLNGQAVYVYGIHPAGGDNLELHGSGNYRVGQ